METCGELSKLILGGKITPQKKICHFFKATFQEVCDRIPSISKGLVERTDAGVARCDTSESFSRIFAMRRWVRHGEELRCVVYF
jgi:hypothetical protein